MRIKIQKVGAQKIMFILTDNNGESIAFEKFARPRKPPTAEVKRGCGYTSFHLKIRKEIF